MTWNILNNTHSSSGYLYLYTLEPFALEKKLYCFKSIDMMFYYHLHKVLLWTVRIICFIFLLSMYVRRNVKFISISDIIIKRSTLSSAFSILTQDLTLPELLISDPPLNSTPSEAFVTFSNNKWEYLAVLANLLDSVHYFSTRSIIVYGIDC